MSKYTSKRLSGLCLHKGKTYEETYGVEKVEQIKEKMRLAKLGKSFKWSKPHPAGENHPRWILDRTQVKRDFDRGGPLHKQWSRAVKNRDSWTCRMSNENCSGKVIAHHILSWKDYSELRYDIKNGITLCHYHHPRKRIDEVKLSPYFKNLVAEGK